jgi:hypothetical protein
MNVYSSTPGSKQVMRNGAHFADACSPEEANEIAAAMNAGLATILIELGQCPTCKGVGAHEPNCGDKLTAALLQSRTCTCGESKDRCPVHEA